MLIRYCGPGLLGLGITALVAGFMSGMAGNVSAFSTVWTYDIYGAFLNKKASDSHYVAMGRWSTVIGMLVSIATAYLVMNANGIMDYVQALFSFFIAPLFGTVILGMLWKRATRPAASGACSRERLVHRHVCLGPDDGGALRYIAMSADAKPMAENLYRALWSWIICVVVTIVVSRSPASACPTPSSPASSTASRRSRMTAPPRSGRSRSSGLSSSSWSSSS